MKLRNLRTTSKRSLSKAKRRFALATALLSLTASVAHSQSFPEYINSEYSNAYVTPGTNAESVHLPSLPFPLAPQGTERSTVRVESKLVGMLGLGAQRSHATNQNNRKADFAQPASHQTDSVAFAQHCQESNCDSSPPSQLVFSPAAQDNGVVLASGEEPARNASGVQPAVTSYSYGPQGVSLAVASSGPATETRETQDLVVQSESTDDDLLGSLLDISIDIPTEPSQPNVPRAVEMVINDHTISEMPSPNDQSAPISMQIGDSDEQTSRAPQLVSRGKTMRLTIEPETLPAPVDVEVSESYRTRHTVTSELPTELQVRGGATEEFTSGTNLPEYTSQDSNSSAPQALVNSAEGLSIDSESDGEQTRPVAASSDMAERFEPMPVEMPALESMAQPMFLGEASPAGDADSEMEALPTYSGPAIPRAEARVPARVASQVRPLAVESAPELSTRIDDMAYDRNPTDVARSEDVSAEAVVDGMSRGDQIIVGQQDSAPVSTTNQIAEYSVEHPSVAKLIRTSDNSLSLIGLQNGQTRIAVVTVDASGERNVEIRAVKVANGISTQADLRTLSREVTQTISRLYPRSQVEVVTNGSELIVQGIVESERDARRVLSLVRKTALTPVVDRLQAYGK